MTKSAPIPMPRAQFGPGIVAHAPPKGAGPRHLAFHPGGKFAYLMTEYSNTLTALWRETDGTLTPLQVITTLPAGFVDTSYGAHIQVNAAGTVVYVSNRGHNSIASFAIGADGHLTPLQTISCGGDWPRFFLLLDHHLIVANQRNDLLVVFTVAADGTLTPNGKTLALGKPVALQVLESVPGTIAPPRHLSLGGEVGRRPGEGAFQSVSSSPTASAPKSGSSTVSSPASGRNEQSQNTNSMPCASASAPERRCCNAARAERKAEEDPRHHPDPARHQLLRKHHDRRERRREDQPDDDRQHHRPGEVRIGQGQRERQHPEDREPDHELRAEPVARSARR